MVSWENSPKRKVHTLKGKLTLTDYTRTQIDHNRQKQSDIDCTVYELDYKRLEKSDIDFKILLIPLLNKVVVSAF